MAVAVHVALPYFTSEVTKAKRQGEGNPGTRYPNVRGLSWLAIVSSQRGAGQLQLEL